MNYAKVTPADLRSDAEKLCARADALEQGLKFFDGKICELCEEKYRQVTARSELDRPDHSKLNSLWVSRPATN